MKSTAVWLTEWAAARVSRAERSALPIQHRQMALQGGNREGIKGRVRVTAAPLAWLPRGLWDAITSDLRQVVERVHSSQVGTYTPNSRSRP
jgi:hypothetical protein